MVGGHKSPRRWCPPQGPLLKFTSMMKVNYIIFLTDGLLCSGDLVPILCLAAKQDSEPELTRVLWKFQACLGSLSRPLAEETKEGGGGGRGGLTTLQVCGAWDRPVCLLHGDMGMSQNKTRNRAACFSLWFHLPGSHFGYRFLTHPAT